MEALAPAYAGVTGRAGVTLLRWGDGCFVGVTFLSTPKTGKSPHLELALNQQ
jgi:thiamine pyrophosphate-dependent acetolactate synthase large subunit-like protein